MTTTPSSTTPPSTPTRADRPTAKFLTALFVPGDYTCIRPIETWTDPNGRKRSRVDHRGIQYILNGSRNGSGEWRPMPADYWTTKLSRIAERSAKQGTNTFFGVCPRFGAEKYDLAWQIRTVRTLWADVDDCTVDEALKRCEKAGLPKPSIVVNSGNGSHLYWLLSEPYLIDDAGGDPLPVQTEWLQNGEKRKPHRYIIDPATKEKLSLDARQNVPELSPKAVFIQDVNSGIAVKIGGDHTHDPSRILRGPGTLNRKNERNGQPPQHRPDPLIRDRQDRCFDV